MKKDVNKKTAFWIIGILIVAFIISLLLIPTCAPCRYGSQTELCMGECTYASKWKVILFNTTGINFDYKEKSQILPKPF